MTDIFNTEPDLDYIEARSMFLTKIDEAQRSGMI